MSNRKEFLKQGSCLLGMSLLPKIDHTLDHIGTDHTFSEKILPPRLRKGDTIGLITPAAPVKSETVQAAVQKLKSAGFKTYYLPSVLSAYGYFAGSDQERAEELMHMFINPNVHGIMCVRGGYGTSRILDLLDYDLIRKHPKVFIGYSDITALHIAIGQNTGLVTYHGLMGICDFNDFAVQSFFDILVNPGKEYVYPYQREDGTSDNPEFDLYTITPG